MRTHTGAMNGELPKAVDMWLDDFCGLDLDFCDWGAEGL